MFSQRLDRLETDLKVLNSMQDLLLQFEGGENGAVESTFSRASVFSDDVPERDSPVVPRKTNTIRTTNAKSLKSTQKKKVNSSSQTTHEQTHKSESVQSSRRSNEKESTCGYSRDMEITAGKITEQLEKEKEMLKEHIEKEKGLRMEVEESAKQVYIKLQKVVDELEREKKTKESLLMGTLQLKNLMHGYDTKIKELSDALTNSKIESQQKSNQVHKLSTENTNTLKMIKHLCKEVDCTNVPFTSPFDEKADDLARYVNLLRSSLEELRSKKREKVPETQNVEKLTSELNTVLGHCEKLKEECNRRGLELKQCLERENNLKQQLHDTQMSITTLETELYKKEIEYDCLTQKLKSDCQIEKEMGAVKISELSSVIRRMKELLITLRDERDQNRKQLEEARGKNCDLTDRIQLMESDRQILISNMQKLSQHLQEVTKEKDAVAGRAQTEKRKLEVSLQKYSLERRKCLGLLNEMKSQLVNLKGKSRDEAALLQDEKQKVLTENKRLDENIRVIQKISEDQGHTIQKLRGDLDTAKNNNFKLETQLRDYESIENQLVRKLKESEKKIEDYNKHIEDLEEKLERYAEDVRTHDCDDYVDSEYKRKLGEMAESFQRKAKQWEETVRDISGERDEAVETAKKTMDKVGEAVKHHNSQLEQVKKQFKIEANKIAERHEIREQEHKTKIHQLQSELDRMKLSSSQIQRALSTKIHQLQAALNICIGGSNQNNSSLGLLHQPHNQFYHPVAAFGNTGSVGNSFNHGASSTNLPFNSSAGLSTQTHAASFQNSNVCGCTSGVPSEPCPTNGSLGVGFIDNLIM